MVPHFRNYYWKDGKPIGAELSAMEGCSYRIITDPYKKRFSVERYEGESCEEVIYDSNLFDFRHLKVEETDAWQRQCIEESPEKRRSLIRNMDERVILIEEAHFQDDCCRECTIYSPHGIWIATQKIFRTSCGDSFDGVTLFDRTHRPVLTKKYAVEEDVFTTLLCEEW